MIKEYTRTTHNFNNETREWEYNHKLDEFNNLKPRYACLLGVHCLESGRWSNIDSAVRVTLEYLRQEEPNLDLLKNEDIEKILKKFIEEDFDDLEKLGLVKSKIIKR